MRPLILVLACLMTGPGTLLSQTLGVIGSSSAFGLDANPISDSSWVNLTAAWYRSQGQLTTLNNLAQSGASSYAGLPSSHPAGPGYPSVDATHNVTTVLNLHPDVVIVAYPSNDLGLGYTLTRWLANLREIRDSIVKAGKRYYIGTSQPRSDLNMPLRLALKEARDSILAEFPFTLNFYDVLVDPATLGILAQYDAGQGVHVNNAGHKALFAVAKAANLMGGSVPLPLTLTSFTGQWTSQTIRLHWDFSDPDDIPIAFNVQKSLDGASFTDEYETGNLPASPSGSYSWTDEHPTNGKSYYRLKWKEGPAEGYSQIISLTDNIKITPTCKVLSPPNGGDPVITIGFPVPQTFRVTIFSISSTPVRRESYKSTTSVTLPLPGLSVGQYILQVIPDKGDPVTKQFTKF